ncbi:MAG: hypothetical protein GY861_17885 [bacterium]|nr:hypothetical protein [bacterium]
MAYTTLAKVKSMFRGITIEADTGDEQTNTAVTTEDVDDFIAEVDAEINGLLSDYYVTPITGTEALLVIGRIAKYKVAHIIKTILEAREELSDKNQEVQTNLEKKANMMLDQIIPTWDSDCCEWVDPRLQLADAVRKTISPKTGAVFGSSKNVATIKKGGDNW